MLIREACIIAETLDRIRPTMILDIGSGSRSMREIVQPHIGAAYRGHNVLWSDAGDHAGVLKLDITKALDIPFCFDMVTALSVLEHVEDIDSSIENLRAITSNWLIVSVPLEYPIHHCPIDNGWRPSAKELSARIEGDGIGVVASYETESEQFGAVSGASATIVVARRSDHG